MRLLKVLALVAALSVLAAAAGQKRSTVRGSSVEIPIGEEKKIGGLLIAFEGVEEDSRCPEGVVCVWQGNARAHFSATDGSGARVEFELNTGVQPFAHRLGGYTIKLERLVPHPRVDREIKIDEYVATLFISPARK
jgi:hypothetical protein